MQNHEIERVDNLSEVLGDMTHKGDGRRNASAKDTGLLGCHGNVTGCASCLVSLAGDHTTLRHLIL